MITNIEIFEQLQIIKPQAQDIEKYLFLYFPNFYPKQWKQIGTGQKEKKEK